MREEQVQQVITKGVHEALVNLTRVINDLHTGMMSEKVEKGYRAGWPFAFEAAAPDEAAETEILASFVEGLEAYKSTPPARVTEALSAAREALDASKRAENDEGPGL